MLPGLGRHYLAPDRRAQAWSPRRFAKANPVTALVGYRRALTSGHAALRLLDGSPQLERSDAQVNEDLPGGRIVSCQQGQGNVLSGNVAVLEPQRLTQREFEATLGLRGQCRVLRRLGAVPPPSPEAVPCGTARSGARSVKSASSEGGLGETAHLAQIDSQCRKQHLIVTIPGVRPDDGGDGLLERLRVSATLAQEHSYRRI